MTRTRHVGAGISAERMAQVTAPRTERVYTASAGLGSRGAIETVTVRAITPQAAHTKLKCMGYTRITGITSL